MAREVRRGGHRSRSFELRASTEGRTSLSSVVRRRGPQPLGESAHPMLLTPEAVSVSSDCADVVSGLRRQVRRCSSQGLYRQTGFESVVPLQPSATAAAARSRALSATSILSRRQASRSFQVKGSEKDKNNHKYAKTRDGARRSRPGAAIYLRTGETHDEGRRSGLFLLSQELAVSLRAHRGLASCARKPQLTHRGNTRPDP